MIFEDCSNRICANSNGFVESSRAAIIVLLELVTGLIEEKRMIQEYLKNQ